MTIIGSISIDTKWGVPQTPIESDGQFTQENENSKL